MKRAMIILSMLMMTEAALAASVLTAAQEAEWVRRISTTCKARVDQQKGTNPALANVNSSAACACVARNHVWLAKGEDSAQKATRQLAWVENFFRNPSTMSADPHALADFNYDFETNCLKKADYVNERLKSSR